MIEAATKGAPRAGRAWRIAALALWAALAPGCGFSTAPQPLSRQIIPPQDLRVWMRDRQVLVSWRAPSEGMTRRWQGVTAYRLSLARLPLGCVDCRPLERVELALPPESRDLAQDQGIIVYQFTPAGPPVTWRVQVAVEFGSGSSQVAAPGFVDAVGAIPAHDLSWERVGPGTLGAGGRAAIRLYWTARRERIVRIVTPGQGQVDRDLMYRVNLYRRVPPEPWPPLPFNPLPVGEQFWIGPEPFLLNANGSQTVEFQLRLVDELGNEGPASNPVSVPIVKGPGI